MARQHARSRFVRVSDLILDEGWSDETLATVVRLLCFLRRRWAREHLDPDQACEVLINGADAQRITGAKREHVAFERLASLPLEAGLSSASVALETICGVTRARLKWPKVAIFQEWERAPSRLKAGGPSHGARRTSHGARKEEEHPASQGGAEAAPLDPERLVNLLGREPGERDVKLAWLRAELPMIELLADEDHPDDLKRRMAAVRSRVLRHYRQHHRSRESSGEAPLTADRILALVERNERQFGKWGEGH